MAISTGNPSKALWPGLKQWYGKRYDMGRLETAMSEDEAIARISVMMLYLAEKSDRYDMKPAVQKAVDELLTKITTDRSLRF